MICSGQTMRTFECFYGLHCFLGSVRLYAAEESSSDYGAVRLYGTS